MKGDENYPDRLPASANADAGFFISKRYLKVVKIQKSPKNNKIQQKNIYHLNFIREII